MLTRCFLAPVVLTFAPDSSSLSYFGLAGQLQDLLRQPGKGRQAEGAEGPG